MTDRWKGLPNPDGQPHPQEIQSASASSHASDTPDGPAEKTSSRMGLIYALMVVAAVGVFMLIRWFGQAIVAPIGSGIWQTQQCAARRSQSRSSRALRHHSL